MCSYHCGVSRAFLWVTWLACTIFATCYTVLSLKTFAKIYEAFMDAENPDNQTVAVLVAAFAGAAMVVGFSIISFLLLISKQVSSSRTGYMYGFVNALALALALLCLLCGLVLTAFEEDIEVGFSATGAGGYSWSNSDTNVFKSTYWFAFVNAAAYFVLFLVMILASCTIDRQNSLLEEEHGK